MKKPITTLSGEVVPSSLKELMQWIQNNVTTDRLPESTLKKEGIEAALKEAAIWWCCVRWAHSVYDSNTKDVARMFEHGIKPITGRDVTEELRTALGLMDCVDLDETIKQGMVYIEERSTYGVSQRCVTKAEAKKLSNARIIPLEELKAEQAKEDEKGKQCLLQDLKSHFGIKTAEATENTEEDDD